MPRPLSPTDQLLRWFEYEHLPEGAAKATSRRLHGLARFMAGDLPDGPEKTAGLRKLLEAKDCLVRASLSERPMPASSPPHADPRTTELYMGAGPVDPPRPEHHRPFA